MAPLPVAIWCKDGLDPELESFLEALCPVLDRAAQDVSCAWGCSDVHSRIYPPDVGPNRGAFNIELRQGVGPAGIHGYHDEQAIVVYRPEGLGVNGLCKALSHELFEAMVNPTGKLTAGPYALEVCDPVSVTPWMVRGPSGKPMTLSNFVLPSYFGQTHPAQPKKRPTYPYDHLGVLHAPGHPEPGAYQTVNGDLVQGPRTGGHRA